MARRAIGKAAYRLLGDRMVRRKVTAADPRKKPQADREAVPTLANANEVARAETLVWIGTKTRSVVERVQV